MRDQRVFASGFFTIVKYLVSCRPKLFIAHCYEYDHHDHRDAALHLRLILSQRTDGELISLLKKLIDSDFIAHDCQSYFLS